MEWLAAWLFLGALLAIGLDLVLSLGGRDPVGVVGIPLWALLAVAAFSVRWLARTWSWIDEPLPDGRDDHIDELLFR